MAQCVAGIYEKDATVLRNGQDVIGGQSAEQSSRPSVETAEVGSLAPQAEFRGAPDHLLQRRVVGQEALDETGVLFLGATELRRRRRAV